MRASSGLRISALSAALLLAGLHIAVRASAGDRLDSVRPTGVEVAPELARCAPEAGGMSPAASRTPSSPTSRSSEPNASPSSEGEARGDLTLDLVDASNGAPIAAPFHLWRLDLPEDERFTAGDLDLGAREAPLGRAVVHDLAPGRYRIACGIQRRGAEDPLGFVLDGSDARVELALELPREREVFLVLFDERGARLDEAELFGTPRRSEHRSPYEPAWPHPRRAKDGLDAIGLSGSYGGLACGGSRSWRRVAAEARGFPLGRSREDSQELACRWSSRWRGVGRTQVNCNVRGSDLGEPVYAGASIDAQSVLRHVLLPEGGDARAFTKHARIECEALLVERDGFEAAWRELEVAVELEAPGYEPLAFGYHPAEGEPTDRGLEPLREH